MSCQRNCRYRMSTYYAGQFEGGCDYISMTRRSRVKKVYETLGVRTLTKEALALLAPENCPCYERGKRGRVIALEMMTRKTKAGQGASGGGIAPAPKGPRDDEGKKRGEGIPASAASARNDGEKKAATRKRRHTFDTEEARRLWGEGQTDRQIGERVGVSRVAINLWRRELGLTSNAPAPRRLDGETIRKLNAQGLNDRQISERTGINPKAICRWRGRNGVPGVKPAGRKT